MSEFMLYLLRHGIAEDFDPLRMSHDRQRCLTEEGKAKLQIQAQTMDRWDLQIKRIIASPYERTKQTALIIQDNIPALRSLAIEFSQHLIHHVEPHMILNDMAASSPTHPILLVGHNPHLPRLASYLLTGHDSCHLELKKGGLMAFHMIQRGLQLQGHLLWMVTPQILRNQHQHDSE